MDVRAVWIAVLAISLASNTIFVSAQGAAPLCQRAATLCHDAGTQTPAVLPSLEAQPLEKGILACYRTGKYTCSLSRHSIEVASSVSKRPARVIIVQGHGKWLHAPEHHGSQRSLNVACTPCSLDGCFPLQAPAEVQASPPARMQLVGCRLGLLLENLSDAMIEPCTHPTNGSLSYSWHGMTSCITLLTGLVHASAQAQTHVQMAPTARPSTPTEIHPILSCAICASQCG